MRNENKDVCTCQYKLLYKGVVNKSDFKQQRDLF